MATLINKQTNEKIILRVNHTFGRDQQTNITALHSVSASRNHAVISWDGEQWRLKDSSTNGTCINRARIGYGTYHTLKDGAKIQFGNQPAETWEVLDLHNPVTCLIPLHASLALIHLYDIEIIALEDEEIMIYLAEDGFWHCEINGEHSVLKTGDTVGYNTSLWQFVDARPSEATASLDLPPPSDDIQFNFEASQNEEHVSLKLVVNNSIIEFGERNHHYLLLLMARQRLTDQEKGIDRMEQGWIKKDVLVQMLGMAEQHINIQIYRFRKQVASTLPHSTTLHQVIERRPGELRFAYNNITIKGGFQNKSQVM
ncbi:MAG: FHA domain-containing protein [Pseudomonadota bacterium]